MKKKEKDLPLGHAEFHAYGMQKEAIGIIERLLKENRELREALGKIADYEPICISNVYAKNMAKIARKALGEGE